MANRAIANELCPLILQHVPADGTSIGNMSLKSAVKSAARAAKIPYSAATFEVARIQLIEAGFLSKGKGRGDSVRRNGADASNPGEGVFDLLPHEASPSQEPRAAARRGAKPRKASARLSAAPDVAEIVSYRHAEKRKNNPEIGMVNAETDPDQPKTEWRYDPHLAPELQFDVGRARVEKLIDDALASGDDKVMRGALEELRRLGEPFLNWAGKAERTSFEVDTVSLYVHERIDPASILAAVAKRVKDAKKGVPSGQVGLFSAPFENLPLRRRHRLLPT